MWVVELWPGMGLVCDDVEKARATHLQPAKRYRTRDLADAALMRIKERTGMPFPLAKVFDPDEAMIDAQLAALRDEMRRDEEPLV